MSALVLMPGFKNVMQRKGHSCSPSAKAVVPIWFQGRTLSLCLRSRKQRMHILIDLARRDRWAWNHLLCLQFKRILAESIQATPLHNSRSGGHTATMGRWMRLRPPWQRAWSWPGSLARRSERHRASGSWPSKGPGSSNFQLSDESDLCLSTGFLPRLQLARGNHYQAMSSVKKSRKLSTQDEDKDSCMLLGHRYAVRQQTVQLA